MCMHMADVIDRVDAVVGAFEAAGNGMDGSKSVIGFRLNVAHVVGVVDLVELLGLAGKKQKVGGTPGKIEGVGE